MAAVIAATYPDMYAAVGVHSGLPYRSATDLPSAFAAMRGNAGPRGRRSRKPREVADDSTHVRTIIFHGDADKIVHPSNGTGIVGGPKLGESIERAEARSSAGRSHTRTLIRDQSGVVVVEEWLPHGSGHAWSAAARTARTRIRTARTHPEKCCGSSWMKSRLPALRTVSPQSCGL